jgi:SAM-dependent methyltransferase
MQRDEYYWDYAAKTRIGKYLTGIEIDFISQCFTALPQRPEIILDAGAGSGRLEPLLTKFASKVIATEVVPSLIRRLAHFGDKVVPLQVNGNIKSLPFTDSHFDCIICVEVASLVHQDRFYAECQRVLKPRGTMIIVVTNRNSWKGFIAVLKPKRYEFGPKSYYLNSIQEIKRCLQSHGFAIRRAVGLNWIPFTRASDNPLVGFFANLEMGMQLHKLVYWSPWVLLEIYKGKDDLQAGGA